MRGVSRRLEGMFLRDLVLQLLKFFLFSVLESLDPIEEVLVDVVLVTLRDDLIRHNIDLRLKSAVPLGLPLHLLLLMLHLQLPLDLPLLLLLKEFPEVPLFAVVVGLRLETGVDLVGVPELHLLIDLGLLLRLLDDLLADHLLVALMNGHVLLPRDDHLSLPVDLRLLPELLQLSLGAQQLDPLFQLLPPRRVLEEPSHRGVQDVLGQSRGVVEAVEHVPRRGEVHLVILVLQGLVVVQKGVRLGVGLKTLIQFRFLV
jgi:hypothetical protein